MRFPKKLIFKLSMILVVTGLLGCGVKGDPLPPEKPADIGRGRPTYKRATEDLKLRKVTPRKVNQKYQDDEEDDERE